MSTFSRPLSFFIFLILLTSSNTLSQSTNARLITKKLFHKICSKARNPSLCLNNLKPLEAKSVVPNSITALGLNSMNMALHQAKTTADLIWQHYRDTDVDKYTIRLRYHICFTIYALDVMNQLTKAKEHMSAGAAKSVKKCISVAVKGVNSCKKGLMKEPYEQSRVVMEANDVFKDVCSIILAICNKVP
ncbi:hypothetical protein CDL12_20612 [Handroanthus impetiginosus]|uniref:Pectinesterase inhibitor domain-containing protein n=1 Tax=Handroanthus impetiginosus TaxID=429701 RepID=A0A2G9GNG9_9LAMI|nr:hypothetical protein CDL12_20612 [Handroanthus impetiginosus]